MKDYFKENIQLYSILIVWLITGMYGGPAIYGVLPVTLFLMKRQGLYMEMLIGFFFILILSDSYEIRLLFAKSAKNIYISLLAIFFLFDTKEFQPINSLYKLFFPFFLISVYCLFYTETFGISVQKTISYYLMIIIIPNYFAKAYRDNGIVFFKNLIFFVVTILIISAVLVFIHRDIAFTGDRYRGILGNPNGLGLFCFLIFILFSVIKNIHADLFKNREVVFIYALLIVSMILSGSRNSILGVGIFVLFQRFYKVNKFLGFLMAIIFIFLVALISSNLTSIITSLGFGDFFRVKTLDDGSGRYVAWGFAWKQVQGNFFIGKGFGYDEHYMRSNWDLLSKMGHQGGVHNTFLTFWMDMGLVGLVIYLRSFFLAFIKAAKETSLAYPIMFVIIFTAFFESWLVGSLNPHTIIFLMILALISDEQFYLKKEELTIANELE